MTYEAFNYLYGIRPIEEKKVESEHYMNKQVKLLAEQAGSTHKQSLGVYQFYETELEKFAELIVLEVINTASHIEGIHNIMQHFGIEDYE